MSGRTEVAVPASYNDLFADSSVRDRVGDVWYQASVHVPQPWGERRIVLRFDAAGFARVQGNKKGVFTRERHPKAAASALRRRWCKDV